MGRSLQKDALKKQKRMHEKAIAEASPSASTSTKASKSGADGVDKTKKIKIRSKANAAENADGTPKKAVRRIRREKVFEGGVMPTKKFRRAPFVRLTKAMVADIYTKEGGLAQTADADGVETQMRISKAAFDMAQALVEQYVSRLYRSATEVAKMSGKVTLKPQMLSIALKLSHNEYN